MLGQAMGGIGGQPMVQYQQQTQQVYQQSLGLQQVPCHFSDYTVEIEFVYKINLYKLR